MRCYVALNLNGSTQYFQRDREERDKDGKWFRQPYFVVDRKLATQMDALPAKVLVNRLRTEFRESPWLEGVENRERIDVPRESSPSEPEKRKPVIATLNDIDWYIVKPADTPQGAKWFVHVKNPRVPGEAVPLYANSPLEVLERAEGLGYLGFLEKYIPPAPAAPAQPPTNQPRLRPGSR